MGADHNDTTTGHLASEVDELLTAAGVPRHDRRQPSGGYQLVTTPRRPDRPAGVEVTWVCSPALAEAIGQRGAARTAEVFHDPLAGALEAFGFPLARTPERRPLVIGSRRPGSVTAQELSDARRQLP